VAALSLIGLHNFISATTGEPVAMWDAMELYWMRGTNRGGSPVRLGCGIEGGHPSRQLVLGGGLKIGIGHLSHRFICSSFSAFSVSLGEILFFGYEAAWN
jgi:hypothetical protein